MKLTLRPDGLFSLSLSTSGTVSIGTVCYNLFVRYLVLLQKLNIWLLLLKPSLYICNGSLYKQTKMNSVSIDDSLIIREITYCVQKVGWVTTGVFLVELVSISFKTYSQQPWLSVGMYYEKYKSAKLMKSPGILIILEETDHHKSAKKRFVYQSIQLRYIIG